MNKKIPVIILFFILIFSNLFSDEKIGKKARQFFVLVEFEILKNESPFFDKNSYDEFQDYYDNKKKLRTYGIAISENTIMIEHLPLMSGRLKNIIVKSHDGKEFKAELEGYGLNRDLQTLKIEGKLSFPKFKKIDLTKNNGPLYATTLAFREIFPYVITKEVSSEWKALSFFEKNSDIYPFEDLEGQRGISLLLNKNGDPLYLQTRNYYKIKNIVSTFTIDEIKSIALDDFESKEDLITAKLHKEIFFVQVYFRQKLEDENNYMNESQSTFSLNSPEAKLLGVLLNEKGELLLPYHIPIEKIKDIEKIEILTPEKTYPAFFKGSYATLGAALITCDQLKGLKPKIELGQSTEEELIISASLLWNSPEDFQIEILPNRLVKREYGVDDRVSYFVKQRLNHNQTIFFNNDLNICGIYSKFKNIDNIKNEGGNEFYSGVDYLSYISLFEIKNEILMSEKYLDNRAMQQNRQDALTPTWLGVNVQAPSSVLLEHFKILDKTKNGLIGLLVTQVYANSPAQKIGLKPLDVLLSVTYEDSDREFEFIKTNDYNSFNYGQYDIGNRPRLDLFPPRKNEITNVLSKLETGKTVILKYLREGKVLTAPFVLEKAPKDFSNADKFVDDDIGLHVKDITYEVRDSLRLKENENGVIISEVEQGKAADLSQLQIYYIILKVDNTPISSVANFKEYITSKKAAGVTEFSFTILFLGKTSLIKLNLKN